MHDSSPSIHFRPQWTSYNIEMESYWCGVHSMPVFFDFIILLKGTLCLSLIRPHLKFACSVWNLHTYNERQRTSWGCPQFACSVWDLHTMNDKALPEDVQNLHFRWPPNNGAQVIRIDIMNVLSLADPDSSSNCLCFTRLFVVGVIPSWLPLLSYKL